MPRYAKKKLLIVDDEDIYVMVAVELFQLEGFDVDTAGSITEAKDKLRTNRYDVALVDYELPDGIGIELFKMKLGHPPAWILQSGHTIKKTEALHHVEILRKPV